MIVFAAHDCEFIDLELGEATLVGWSGVIAIVVILIAWRALPSFVEGYRGKRGGFFAAVGGALGRRLRR